MHAIEKILAEHAGLPEVHTGEVITAKVDFAEINDLYPQTIDSFYDMGGKKVFDPEKIAFCFDHYAPCSTAKCAENHTYERKFAKEMGLTHHFDVNAGVCHQVMPEAGLIKPGMIVVATDSHTTTHGAFGAFGTGCGATDMACILLEGELWFRVPEIVEIRLEGKTAPGVYAKDVVLYALGRVRADGAVYKAIDFTGSYVDSLRVDERMTICNMAVEMGAKTAYMQPNENVLAYVKEHGAEEFKVQKTDDDFVYADSVTIDVSEITPQLACPSSVENVHPLTEVIGEKPVKINQAYLGSCTNARVEDIRIAAKILEGKHIADDVRMLIVPASAQVLKTVSAEGTLAKLLDAGCTLVTPGCAACLGVHNGLIGDGEVCITATNRNFTGRMGAKGGMLYLASPATVAASALKGYITDPREVLA